MARTTAEHRAHALVEDIQQVFDALARLDHDADEPGWRQLDEIARAARLPLRRTQLVLTALLHVRAVELTRRAAKRYGHRYRISRDLTY
jgi:hypothetical protein